MGLEDTTPAVPAAPVADPPAAPEERTFRTNSEKRFFERQASSSLPNTPIETPPQTTTPTEAPPIPTEPIQAAPDEPLQTAEPAEIAEDDFSVELPGTEVPDDGVLLDATVRHPDSPLEENAPLWQHDAFSRLQSDTSISEEEKKTISELPPSSWDRARRWAKDTKLLGQFRDPEVPIATVFDILSKQSKERVGEIEVESINRVLSNPDMMVSFSEKHPQLYATLLSELVNNHSEFVATTLQKAGFNVVKAEPFDKEKILDKLRSHPMWDTFSETDIAEMVESQIDELAAMVSTGKVSPEDLAAELGKQESQAPVDNQFYQQVTNTVNSAQDNHWLKAVGDGLQTSGIRPATQEEINRNPAAAHLKTIIYNAALYGLKGVITDWDAHSSKWGKTQPGFTSTFEELASYLQSGDVARFEENAPSMNPFYFEFGQKRARTALIQNLYKAVDKLLVPETTPPPPLPGTPPPTIDGQSTPPGERKYRTNSERRYFESIGK